MKIISLFSGAGGLDCGLIRAGHVVAWANDADPDAVKTYQQNIGSHIVYGDMAGIDAGSLPSADVVVGGFPCQGFSLANLRRAISDERNAMYVFFKKAVAAAKPKFFIAENVKGILSLGGGSVINKIIADFQAVGYQVKLHKANAADYGVPQHRERVFIFGQRRDLGDEMALRFPAPTHAKAARLDRRPWVTMREALEAMPPGYSPAFDPNAVGSEYHCRTRNFTGHRASDPDKPCPTILARGNGKGGVCAIPHYNGERRLTIRESAIIQTFPVSFAFYGKMGSCYRQIGNAVPVLLAQRIGEELARAEARLA